MTPGDTSTPAADLRDLVRRIEDLCRGHRASSLARPAIAALSDYLTLRARVMETNNEAATTPANLEGK